MFSYKYLTGRWEEPNWFSCICSNMSINQCVFIHMSKEGCICMYVLNVKLIACVICSPLCCCGWSPYGSGQVWGGGTLQCWWPECSTHVSKPHTAAGGPGRHPSGEGPQRSPYPPGCCGSGERRRAKTRKMRFIHINKEIMACLQLPNKGLCST